MICILKINCAEVEGWILADDVHDARRKAQNMMSDEGHELARVLYQIEFPRPGKHRLPTGHTMLVS